MSVDHPDARRSSFHSDSFTPRSKVRFSSHRAQKCPRLQPFHSESEELTPATLLLPGRATAVPGRRDVLPWQCLPDRRQSLGETVQILQKWKRRACLPPLHPAPGPTAHPGRWSSLPETGDTLRATSPLPATSCLGSPPSSFWMAWALQ